MFNLHTKVALVTGAGTGMGRTDAILLASQGAKVAVTGPDLEQCRAVADDIVGKGGEAIALQIDVSDDASVARGFDDVLSVYGRLDILVNNAGIYQPKPALELDRKEWDRTLAVNLTGQFLCARRAAEEMRKNNWGRIINISSIASGGVGIGIPGAAHYTASKGGIIAMTETLAGEWAQYGITVNAIAPGAIDTPMAASVKASKDILDPLLAKIPLRRMGKPEEISAAVVFLASDEASYVTGATLYVDGGWLAA
jgi:NAD(P)-dependent dehydrogenase (short-subunit alcohol dehydrogenase family)